MIVKHLLPALILCVPLLLAHWCYAWRIALLYALIAGFLWRISPPVHWSDEGWAYSFVMAIIYINVIFTIVCFSLRALLHYGKGNRDTAVPPNPALSGLDHVLTIATAFLVTFLIFIPLSWLTAGHDAPLLIHGGLILAAIAIVRFAKIATFRVVRGFATSVAIALGVMTLASATYYPMAILSAAEKVADGAPYCIALHSRRRKADAYGDLTFLTFDKNAARRHASLHVATGGGTKVFNYSYYRTRFLPYPGWPTPISCAPSTHPLAP